MVGGVVEELGPECRISLPTYRASGTIEQTPLGRVYVAGEVVPGSTTRTVPLPSQSTVSWVTRGVDALAAEDARAELVALLDNATRLYFGDCWLTVVRLAGADPPEPRYVGLSHKGTHTYDLFSPEFEDATGRRGRMPW